MLLLKSFCIQSTFQRVPKMYTSCIGEQESILLLQTTVFKTDTDYRSTTQQICKVKREQKIARGEEVTWYCDQLVVPPIPPSCLIGCNIISINYTLEVIILSFIKPAKTSNLLKKHTSSKIECRYRFYLFFYTCSLDVKF